MINRFVTTYLSILNEQNQTQIFDSICQKLAYQDNDVQIAKTYFINLLEHYKCKFPNQFKNISFKLKTLMIIMFLLIQILLEKM